MAGPNSTTIKFFCSYRGKILPRYPDCKLCYHGDKTRVLSVNRSISFSELLLKMGEMRGKSVSLRCQLPTRDLNVLVSISSDEELTYLIKEYDRSSSSPESFVKIRSFLSWKIKLTSYPTLSPSLSLSLTTSTSSNSPSTTLRLSSVRQMIPWSHSVVPLCCPKTSKASDIDCHGYQVQHC
ncbi:uncharacterized protein LOC120203807 [Hibiscus syriacus]|uniref:uncharacterized protein LOC120203807 n=1 Tax=Hibiscus syriacus TaxID=106335 RepID=UPI0019234383|nr:uncharacterized protein LOC120203807 [Hibiscus syriacus]